MLFVDTGVRSLAFRRDHPTNAPGVDALTRAINEGEIVVTTGLVLQELLQGFVSPRARRSVIERFTSLPLLMSDRQDHIDATELRNRCHRAGVQLETIDAVPFQLCMRHGLTMLTTYNDFVLASKHAGLRVWR